MSVKKHSLLTTADTDLFKAGKYYHAHEKLGSHSIQLDGEWGYYFAVWAPNAKAVSVIGDFNDWKRKEHPLHLRTDYSGIWEGFIPGIKKGLLYKYAIDTKNGDQLTKGDPYGHYWEIPPNTATVTWDLHYEWNDDKWMKKRKRNAGKQQAYSVYEVHLGSWRKQKDDYTQSLDYRSLATELVDYVKKMDFTHVELMPVMEHPYFPSWGYQITGYFAPSSRFGSPQDFMYLIDKFHQAGIGVLLDWVPSHFPTDAHGLGQFDGTPLYEHPDSRLGFHPDWKSNIFNYSRNEIRSFLISNALFWLEYFHIDGFRVDAVASMIYLDYSRDEGQWLPNKYGGNEYLEAIAFLKEMNTSVQETYPDVVTIAEESTAFPGVSHPVSEGGLGFHQKWMMGWMHDTLKYFMEAPIHRPFHHHTLTFSLVYAFSENFMLPLSHDEVVHGKGPIIDRMRGDYDQRFSNMRLLYGYMYTHPGTKILFMGNEFGQTTEWKIEQGVNWPLLEKKEHKGLQKWVKALNTLYKKQKALYEQQFIPEGFEWINHGDHQKSIISYTRKGKKKNDLLVIVCNFSTKTYDDFRVGVPQKGTYSELLNSNSKRFGGDDTGRNAAPIKADEKEWDGQAFSIGLELPALGVVVFELK